VSHNLSSQLSPCSSRRSGHPFYHAPSFFNFPPYGQTVATHCAVGERRRGYCVKVLIYKCIIATGIVTSLCLLLLESTVATGVEYVSTPIATNE
jgi:hypothetical protein